MTSPAFDSVLLIGFGGPTQLDEVRPFLANVTRGRPIPAERLDEVARHYELIGGSPFNRLTLRQAEALTEELRRAGYALPVYVGMRNWHPLLSETLAEMAAHGRRRAVGVILSAQQTEAGWDRYVADVVQARAEVAGTVPEVVFAAPWPLHPLYLEAVADRVRTAFAEIDAPRRARAHVIFTAHSVPAAMAANSNYADQVTQASAAVVAAIGATNWSVAYQSRSGNPRDPWLGPDVNEALRDLAAQGVRDAIVAPIGFVCDHVEVLYDIGVEAAATAERCGVRLVRAETVNDHPLFIRMLSEIVQRTIAETP